MPQSRPAHKSSSLSSCSVCFVVFLWHCAGERFPASEFAEMRAQLSSPRPGSALPAQVPAESPSPCISFSSLPSSVAHGAYAITAPQLLLPSREVFICGCACCPAHVNPFDVTFLPILLPLPARPQSVLRDPDPGVELAQAVWEEQQSRVLPLGFAPQNFPGSWTLGVPCTPPISVQPNPRACCRGAGCSKSVTFTPRTAQDFGGTLCCPCWSECARAGCDPASKAQHNNDSKGCCQLRSCLQTGHQICHKHHSQPCHWGTASFHDSHSPRPPGSSLSLVS